MRTDIRDPLASPPTWLPPLLCLGLLGCGKEAPKKRPAPADTTARDARLRAPLRPPGPPAPKVADLPHSAPLELAIAPTGSVGQPLGRYPLPYRRAMALLDAFEGDASQLLEARKLARAQLDAPKASRRDKALAHVALGRATYKAGFRKSGQRRPANLVRAERHFDKALKLQPGLFEALVLRAHTHLFAGDLAKARADLARATRRRRRSVDLLSLRAAVAAREQKHAEVVRLEKELLSRTKHKWLRRGAYTRLATTYALLKRPREAGEAYRALLALVPDSVWAHLGQAGFSINQGQPDVALRHARRALALMHIPASRRIYAQACYAKGRELLWKQKRAADAWGYFLHATRYAPKDADAHHGLGVALQEVARLERSLWALDRAGAALRRAVQLAPKHALATKALAEHEAGYAKAKRWIESAPATP